MSIRLGTGQHRKTISVSIPRVFVVKKDFQSYTITTNKNKSNVAANACEGFGIIRNITINIVRFMPDMRLCIFTFRQFRGTKFSILSIVLMSVTL